VRHFAEIIDDLCAAYPGGDVTPLCEIDLVRLSNLVSRREAQLRSTLAKVTARASSPDLAGYLAGRRVTVAAANRDDGADDGCD
jgi:hypothetical protein